MSDPVLVEFVEKGPGKRVAVVTLNRPAQFNAINPALGKALSSAFRGLRARGDVTVCVLTGAGKNFCAGVDLKEPLFADPEIMTPEWIKGEGNYLVQMQKCDFPIIGAVAGYCATGGMEVALNCDVIVAADDAVFWDTHSLYNIRPAGGMSQILPRLVGPGRAKLMSICGHKVAAAQALAWGLVAEVVPREQLMSAATALADGACKRNAEVNQLFKRMINEGEGMSLREALTMEVDQALQAYIEMGKAGGDTKGRLSSQFAGRPHAKM